jgi:hypothetical protein
MVVRIQVPGGPRVDGEVACLALSPDGLLIRFAPETIAPVFLFFRECPQ